MISAHVIGLDVPENYEKIVLTAFNIGERCLISEEDNIISYTCYLLDSEYVSRQMVLRYVLESL